MKGYSCVMHYGYTSLATTWTDQKMNHWKVRLIGALLFFVPRANPDNEKLYPQLAKWLIEIDETGVPSREIGLNAEGTPLFGAPNNRNSGFWISMSDETFDKSELELVDQEHFEFLWAKISKSQI